MKNEHFIASLMNKIFWKEVLPTTIILLTKTLNPTSNLNYLLNAIHLFFADEVGRRFWRNKPRRKMLRLRRTSLHFITLTWASQIQKE
jgi:hypothetical protein